MYTTKLAINSPADFENCVKEFAEATSLAEATALVSERLSPRGIRRHGALAQALEQQPQLKALAEMGKHASSLGDAPAAFAEDVTTLLDKYVQDAAYRQLATTLVFLDALALPDAGGPLRDQQLNTLFYSSSAVALFAGGSAILTTVGGISLVHPSIAVPVFLGASMCVLITRLFMAR